MEKGFLGRVTGVAFSSAPRLIGEPHSHLAHLQPYLKQSWQNRGRGPTRSSQAHHSHTGY